MPGCEEVQPVSQSFELQKVDLDSRESTPENDGVNLQCVNSSDFVIGKQMTFNGPVTIINYSESTERGNDPCCPPKEEIVIREKINSPVIESEKNTVSGEKNEETRKDSEVKDNNNILRRILCTKFVKIPVVIWVLLVIVVVVGCLVFFFRSDEVKVKSSSIKINYNGVDYNYITKKDWRARQPLEAVKMKSPVPYVVISHTAGRFCYLKAVCMQVVRDIQGDHMSRTPPYSDIAYSFLVGGDGNIYEGRGWTTKTANTGFVNGKSININFIGSFENLDPPTYPQTEAVKALIEYGVNNSYIAEDYSLVADSATYPTLSPGKQVYNEIKTWPHFDPQPELHLKE